MVHQQGSAHLDDQLKPDTFKTCRTGCGHLRRITSKTLPLFWNTLKERLWSARYLPVQWSDYHKATSKGFIVEVKVSNKYWKALSKISPQFMSDQIKHFFFPFMVLIEEHNAMDKPVVLSDRERRSVGDGSTSARLQSRKSIAHRALAL